MSPYLSVDKGRITCDSPNLSFPCNRDGCLKMGEKLCELGLDQWMCSSSIDFPTESGGEDIDVAGIIEEGFKARLNTIHDERVAKVAKRVGVSKNKLEDALSYFNVVMKPDTQ